MNRGGLRAVLLLILILGSGGVGKGGCQQRLMAVPAGRLARLTHGINFNTWYADGPEKYTDAELKAVKKAGFRHIRLYLNRDYVFDALHPDMPKPEGVRRLDAILDRILANDLAVIITLEGIGDNLEAQPDLPEKVAVFWRELARHLSARDPERLFLEDVNIPKAPNVERWNTDYPKIVRAMREGAPQHTLIASANWRVTPNQYDDILGLERMEPMNNDPNIVYNFHFYDPFVFTHQNTDWGWEMLKLMHNLPYPSSPESVTPILPSTDEHARNIVEGYGREAWNADKIVQQLRRTSAWAHAHGVSVTCNEFGTWRQVAPAPRARYMRDTCRALDSLHIGWTVFDYDGRFRITTEQAGRRALDPALLKALTMR